MLNNLYPPVAHGGYENECAGVVAHLGDRHDIRVLTSRHRRREAPAQDGVRRVLPFLPHSPWGALRAPVAALRAARIMRRALEEHRPDLVYVWNGARVPHAAIRVAQARAFPVAFRVCEHWFGGLYQRDQFMRHLAPGDSGARALWAALVRLVNRHPALRLDLSPLPAAICWNSQALRRLNPVPPGIEAVLEQTIFPVTGQAEHFAAIERRPAERPTIAFVGRLEEQKGPDVAYRALAVLRERHGVDARLLLAGSGEPGMVRRLRRLARELDVEEHVEVLGPLDREALGELLSTASAMVIPPVWQEPAPLICIEAALARIPVVASRSGGIPELLHPDEHALLFEIGDVDGCAAALARTLEDPAAAAERVRRAFERGRELSDAGYLEATERFVEESRAALTSPAPAGLAPAR